MLYYTSDLNKNGEYDIFDSDLIHHLIFLNTELSAIDVNNSRASFSIEYVLCKHTTIDSKETLFLKGNLKVNNEEIFSTYNLNIQKLVDEAAFAAHNKKIIDSTEEITNAKTIIQSNLLRSLINYGYLSNGMHYQNPGIIKSNDKIIGCFEGFTIDSYNVKLSDVFSICELQKVNNILLSIHFDNKKKLEMPIQTAYQNDSLLCSSISIDNLKEDEEYIELTKKCDYKDEEDYYKERRALFASSSKITEMNLEGFEDLF